jgi:hypothetical protein
MLSVVVGQTFIVKSSLRCSFSRDVLLVKMFDISDGSHGIEGEGIPDGVFRTRLGHDRNELKRWVRRKSKRRQMSILYGAI